MKELKIRSNMRNEMIDITHDIQREVDEGNLVEGYVVAYVPHTTAGITINEGADPSVQRDIIETLKRLKKILDKNWDLLIILDAWLKASSGLTLPSVLISSINLSKLVIWPTLVFSTLKLTLLIGENIVSTGTTPIGSPSLIFSSAVL